MDALTDDDDPTGYHRSYNHTVESLMAATWESLFTPAPRVVVATPFHDFADLWDDHRDAWGHDWWRKVAEGTYLERYGWKGVDEINDGEADWQLVTDRTDIMARFPDSNAIIMCMGRFYLAELEATA